KSNVKVTHNGETFYLYGAPDGIMEYATDDGELIRVGLEIKSKQTTNARTSLYSMREPDVGHRLQAQAYARMFGCDYCVLLYLNLSQKSWSMTDEDYAKPPDIRAVCLHVTEADKAAILGKPVYVTRCVREGTPPPLDLDEWT